MSGLTQGQVTATVSYTAPAPKGRIAGRTVDEQLWARLKPALAVSEFPSAQQALLADADEPHSISVADARNGLAQRPTLESHGFELRRAPSKVKDWNDHDAASKQARAEAEAIVRAVTGAVSVQAFDHTWRHSRRSNFDSRLGPGGAASNMSAAVARVHTDFTAESAKTKIASLAERGVVPADAADGARHRRAIVNVWRAYGSAAAVEHSPLGFIDPSTVAPSSTFPYALVHGDSAGVNGSLSYAPGHEWHYFPAMRPDEVALFLNFEERDASAPHDDNPSGAADERPPRCVYHAALDVQSSSGEAAPALADRLSLEVRVLALWPRGGRVTRAAGKRARGK